MPNGKKEDPRDFSPSDRASLERMARDQQMEEAIEARLKIRRERRIESVKTWITWATAATLAISLIKEAAQFIWSHIKA